MDFQLSEDEHRRLVQAMKKPEFVKLLNEYVEEISDPKNKQEYEAYLKQLETGNELPPGRKLIRPEAHSCIKTTLKTKKNTKCFVNLCIAMELPEPSLERSAKEGGTWSLPYAMGHPRHDQDKTGAHCLTLDCALNPYAFQVAKQSAQFQKLICDTAINAADTMLKPQGERVSQDYKLLKKLKCKGGTPGSILVSESALKDPANAPKAPAEERKYSLQEEGPKLYRELISQQMKQEKENQVKITEEKEESEEEKEEVITGIVAPKYKLTYSYNVDLGDYIDTRERKTQHPKDINITIHVPRLEKLSEANIDMKNRLLTFEVSGVYYLEIRMNNDVDEDAAKARFDRKRKEVKITLPIIRNNNQTKVHQIISSEPIQEVKDSIQESFSTQLESSLEQTLSEPAPAHLSELPIPETPEEPSFLKFAKEDILPPESAPVPSIDEPVVLDKIEYLPKPVSDLFPSTSPIIEEISSPSPFPSELTIDQPSFIFKQDSGSFVYFMFHIPGLIMNTVKHTITHQEISGTWTGVSSNITTHYKFTYRLYADIFRKLSCVDVVIDYVVFRLHKREEKEWASSGEYIPELTETNPVEDPVIEEVKETNSSSVTPCFIGLECSLVYELI
jgi:hypothetical protein